MTLGLSSCLMPSENGKVTLNLSGKDQTTRDAGKAANAPEGERTHASVINVELINDQIKITGSDLDVVTKVTLDGGLLTIVSKTANELLLSSASQVTIALNTLLSLSLEDAYGATVISLTFNLPDSSVSAAKIGDEQVTTAKIADGAITAVKLDSMSATVGQLLRWNGTSWAASDLDALTYAGTWNAFVGGNPNPSAVGGEYYIVSVAGTADPGDGNSRAWSQGDWIIYNSNTSSWDQISNSSDVTSFNGRTGGVVPTTGDYTWAMINKSTSSIGDVADVDLSTAPTTGQVLKFDGSNWVASDDAIGGAAGSVTSSTISDNSIVDADINSAAAIAWSKINKTGAVPSDVGVDIDTTTTLGTDDAKVPSQNAVKTYVDNAISGFSSGTVTSITGGAALSDGPITTTGTLDVQVDGTTIEVASDALQLKDGGITDAKINASAAIAWTKIDKTGASPSDIGLTIDTTTTLGTSNTSVPSQNAVKTYVDSVAGAAGDDLGTHVATQDLDLATFKLVGNGGTTGLVISNTGVVTVSNDVVIGSNSVCQSDGTNCPTGNAGTVTSITGGAGLSDGPITSSGTLDIQVDGVTLEVNGSDALQLKDGGITNAKISASAAIDQSKISGLTTALSGKEDSLSAGTTAQYYRGDKTWQTLDKSAVGLSNLDNIQQMPLSYLSTVTTLGTSDILVPSQNAVKTYVDNSITNYSVTNTDLSGISANCGVGQVITVNGSGDFVCFDPADYADNFFSSFGIGASPDASAALDVSSTTKGFLPPRMTTAQRTAISSPATGLTVYDTDAEALYVYSESTWKSLGGNLHEFRAYGVDSGASFAHGTNTNVIYNNEQYDASSAYNPATGEYTVPEAGTYIFTWAAYIADDGGITSRYSHLKVDGTVVARSNETFDSANSKGAVVGSAILKLTAGQVVNVDITLTTGDSSAMPASANTYAGVWNFSGAKLSGGSGSGGSSDDLGNHTASQNLKLGSFYISNDGGASEGLSFDASGNATFSGSVTATSFTGSGANLTDIPTSAIADNAITLDKIDFASLNGINIPQLASSPGSATAGQTYYNTTTNQLMFYDGTTWSAVGSGTSSTSVESYFMASLTSGSLSGSGVINYNVENSDLNGEFDLTTDRFTPTQAGYYLIIAHTYGDGMTTGAHLFSIILKNGSSVGGGWTRSTASTNANKSTTAVVYMNGSTDYIQGGYDISTGYISSGSIIGVKIGGADNMGSHVASKNLNLANFKLVGNGGTEGLSIDSSGKVGVGTSSPSGILHVTDGNDMYFTSLEDSATDNSFDIGRLTLNAKGASYPEIYLRTVESTSTHTSLLSAGLLNISTTGSTYDISLGHANGYVPGSPSEINQVTRMFIDNGTGNVGIGTKTPVAQLEVAQDDATYGLKVTQTGDGQGIWVNQTGNGTPLWLTQNYNTTGFVLDHNGTTSSAMTIDTASSGDALGVFNGATPYFYVKGSGNVGVGTSSPSAKLQVDGSMMVYGGSNIILRSSGTDAGDLIFETSAALQIGRVWSSAGGTPGLNLAADGTTAQIYVANGGNVGIGTTGPSYKLHVNGTAAGTSWTNTSDFRLKKSISPVERALDKALALEGVTFEWRADEYPEKELDDRVHYGFIAQDVEKVAPELVNTDHEGFKSVEYANITSILVEAFKDFYADVERNKEMQRIMQGSVEENSREIASLKDEVEMLKAENKDLKERLQRIEAALGIE